MILSVKKKLYLFLLLFFAGILSANSNDDLLKLQELLNGHVQQIKDSSCSMTLGGIDKITPQFANSVTHIKEALDRCDFISSNRNVFECLMLSNLTIFLDDIKASLSSNYPFNNAKKFIESWNELLKVSAKAFVFVTKFDKPYLLNFLEEIIILAINVCEILYKLDVDNNTSLHLNLNPNIPSFKVSRLPCFFKKIISKYCGVKDLYLQKFRDLFFSIEEQNEQPPKCLEPLCSLSQFFCSKILKKEVDQDHDPRPVITYKSFDTLLMFLNSTGGSAFNDYFSKLIILDKLLDKSASEKKLMNGLYSLAFLEGARAICQSYNHEFHLEVTLVSRDDVEALLEKFFAQEMDVKQDFVDLRGKIKTFVESSFDKIKTNEGESAKRDDLAVAKHQIAVQTLWGMKRDLNSDKDGVLTRTESVYTTVASGAFTTICGIFLYSGYKTWLTLKKIFKNESFDLTKIQSIKSSSNRTRKTSGKLDKKRLKN